MRRIICHLYVWRYRKRSTVMRAYDCNVMQCDAIRNYPLLFQRLLPSHLYSSFYLIHTTYQSATDHPHNNQPANRSIPPASKATIHPSFVQSPNCEQNEHSPTDDPMPTPVSSSLSHLNLPLSANGPTPVPAENNSRNDHVRVFNPASVPCNV